MAGIRRGSRTDAASKVELFVIIVNVFQPLTIITKSSTSDAAAALDVSLGIKEALEMKFPSEGPFAVWTVRIFI